MDEQVFESIVETLKDLVRIPFVSTSDNNPVLMKKSAEFVLNLFKKEGFTVELKSAPKSMTETPHQKTSQPQLQNNLVSAVVEGFGRNQFSGRKAGPCSRETKSNGVNQLPTLKVVRTPTHPKEIAISSKTFNHEPMCPAVEVEELPASASEDFGLDGTQGNLAIVGYKGANADGSIDPSKKTILLYAHHDVQPAQHPENWKTKPFEPTIVGERMFGRGAADDGAGLVAHLGAARLFAAKNEQLPVNVKIFIEGEEEIGSPSFANFINLYSKELEADVIIVADSGNWAVGVPSITTTLRGVGTIHLELQVLEHDIHSGMNSGPIIDANALLMRTISSIWDDNGEVVVPGLLGTKSMPTPEPTVDYAEPDFRRDSSLLDQVELAGSGSITGRIWTKPSISVIGFDAVSTDKASNVFASKSAAQLSLRIAPGQDAAQACTKLVEHLQANVPFNAKFNATVVECGPAYKADIESPGAVAFATALKEAFGTDVVYSGMGGSIPFTADLKKVFPNAEILLAGVEDPDSRAHSDNESVHLGDLRKVVEAEYLLLKKLGNPTVIPAQAGNYNEGGLDPATKAQDDRGYQVQNDKEKGKI
ncbi:hypothetical protein FACS1894125_4450 [Actinomycetota bacterium]|nr:hypothetical protein FACS1894125_4450 [Actinomycetota bacterium]